MRKGTTKPTLLALLAAMLSFNVIGQTTSLVSIDDSGHLTYKPDEKGNVLPDFSYVGYHHGERPIPDVEVAKAISPLGGDNHYYQSCICHTKSSYFSKLRQQPRP